MQAGEQTEGEGDEVVGDLLLRDLVRAQPDDREDAEQADPSPMPTSTELSAMVTGAG